MKARFLMVPTLAIALSVLLSSAAAGQMEKRHRLLYDQDALNAAKPALGTLAPDMELYTMKGKRVRLSDYRGKTTVLVKAGYT